MKTWLVAHRGASNEAKENTIDAIKAAIKYPVAMIEFDVRVTKDNVAVIHHDAKIGDHEILLSNFIELQKSEPQLAIFEEVIKTANGLPLMVELKGSGSATHVAPYLTTHQQSLSTSFVADELDHLLKLGINGSRLYLAKHNNPFGLQKQAVTYGFGGITVNKYYLTPLFYWRAKQKGLKIFVYTVNNLLIAWLYRKAFPDALICTDKPHKLQKLT